MRLARLIPQRFGTRLVAMTFIAGLVPVTICSLVIGIYGARIRAAAGKTIRDQRMQEWSRTESVIEHLAETAIREKARDVAKQLDLWLDGHPRLTVREMQSRSDFASIAVQPVGRTGYTAVHESSTAINRFHKNPKVVDVDLQSLAGKLPGFWAIIRAGLNGKPSSGYYAWKDADGKIRQKFMFIVPLKRRTGDGVLLCVAATTYVDEFTAPIRRVQAVASSTTRTLRQVIGSQIMSMRNVIGAATGFGILLVLLAAVLNGRYFSRAITGLREATSAVNRGDFSATAPTCMSGDVGELSEDFNKMVATLAETTVSKERLEESEKQLRSVNADLRREVSERQRAEQNARNSERRLADIINFLPDPTIVIDKAGKVIAWNRALEEMTGVPASEMLGNGEYEYSVPFYGERRPALVDAVLDPSVLDEKKYDMVARDGDALLCEVFIPNLKGGMFLWAKATPLYDAEGNKIGAIQTIRDITDKKLYQENLDRLAHHDFLTSLPNRLLFSDRLSREIAQAERNNKSLAVMFLDIDGLKVINDSLGHGAGDQLLKSVAERLVGSIRKSDTVARMGGDEFTVLLTDLQSERYVAAKARKLLDVLAQPFAIDGRELFVTASIGVSVFPADGSDVETLVKNADAAMYRAKEQGRNNHQFYTAAVHAAALERMNLEHGLRRALDRGELRLHFQPRVDIATGDVTAVEALVRWEHPDCGLIFPSQFIPLAEETGLIIPLSAWVLKTSCEQCKQWHQAGLKPVRVSVNVSATELQRSDLVGTVTQVLQETRLAPSSLELEITESTAMHSPEQAIDVLTDLKRMGVRLSIDDFGTGYSSLSYLKKLPIDAVKIDRSFVRDITENPDDAAIAGAVVAMAHSLKLKVVAEGVETLEQLDYLRHLHCDEAQGYFVAYPVPAEDFSQVLSRRSLFGEDARSQDLGEAA